MNKLLKYIPVFAVAVLLWAGCQKEKTELPPREISEEVSEIADRYNKILIAPPDGWVIGYKPDNYGETVYVSMRFAIGQKVDMRSGYRDYHTLQNGLDYGYEGKNVPVIVFSENTVFAALAGLYNGSQKFKISYIENGGYFELTRSDGYDNKTFKLEKASAANTALLNDQIADVLEQIAYEEEQARLSEQTRLKIKGFVEITSDFYFYNLKTENFSAAINKLDTTARQLSLTYKETATSAPKSVTVGYNINPKGIKLNPSISYGNVVIDEIELGDLTNPVLDIVKAGNAGAGKMGYMHEAPYNFTLSTDRNLTLAEYFLTVFPNLLQSSGVFSNKAAEYSESLRNHIEDNTDYVTTSRYVYFIYAPKYTTASSSFFVGAHNSTGGTGNFRYDAVFTSLGNNKFAMNELTRQVLPSGTPNLLTRVSQYLDEVSPDAGVIAVPYDTGAGYRLRLINSSDSRVWVEYRWPSSTYWNLVFN